MLAKIRTWCNTHAPFLLKDTMPVWLTIVASVLAGVAAAISTYYIAPAINRQYQVDQARSAHVAKTTEELNGQIIQLSQKVRRLNEALVNETGAVAEVRGDCLDLVTKLQWMLVDLRVVLKSEDDRKAVTELSNSITKVKAALDTAVDARAQPQLLNAMTELGERTRTVLDRLYVAASLK